MPFYWERYPERSGDAVRRHWNFTLERRDVSSRQADLRYISLRLIPSGCIRVQRDCFYRLRNFSVWTRKQEGENSWCCGHFRPDPCCSHRSRILQYATQHQQPSGPCTLAPHQGRRREGYRLLSLLSWQSQVWLSVWRNSIPGLTLESSQEKDKDYYNWHQV